MDVEIDDIAGLNDLNSARNLMRLNSKGTVLATILFLYR